MVVFSRGRGIFPFFDEKFHYEKLTAIFRGMCLCVCWGGGGGCKHILCAYHLVMYKTIFVINIILYMCLQHFNVL